MQIDIVGAGRVGLALQAALTDHDVHLVRRDAGWEALADRVGAPLVLTPRNDDLAAALARVPPVRRPDLVFVQNGMIRPLLRAHGAAHATRGVLFFAVMRRGDVATPGGTSPFTGPHAASLAAALTGAGLPAAAVSPNAFAEVELEKLLWNSVFGLLGDAFDELVGVSAERDEVAALVDELAPFGEAELGVNVDHAAMVTRMRDYARSIPTFRAGLREWPWRNGWFVEAAGEAALPLHTRLVGRVPGR